MNTLSEGKSLKKISHIIDLALVLLVIVVFAMTYSGLRSDLFHQKEREHHRLIKKINGVVDNFIQMKSKYIQLMLPLLFNASPEKSESFLGKFESLQALYRVSEAMFVEDVLISFQDVRFLEKLDMSQSQIALHIDQAGKSEKVVVTPVHRSVITGSESVSIIYPLKPSVLVAELDIKSLFSVMHSMGLSSLYADAVFILLKPDSQNVLYRSSDRYPYWEFLPMEKEVILIDGEGYHFDREKLKVLGLELVVLTPEKLYRRSFHIVTVHFGILVGMVLLIHLFRRFWINRSLYDPLSSFLETIRDDAMKEVSLGSSYNEWLLFENSYNNALVKIRNYSKELERGRERFELAMRGANDGLWDYDLEAGKTYYSPRWKGMLGYEDHEIGDEPVLWTEHIHPEDQAGVLEYLEKFRAGGQEYFEIEFRKRHKKGHYLNILSRGFGVRNDQGKLVRIVGTHVDITHRKKAEEQLENMVAERTQRLEKQAGELAEARDVAESANRAKSVFLSNMSHELRTPLNAILGFSQLMTHSQNLGEDDLRSLEIIGSSGKHLLSIINDVLTMSKIEAGKVAINKKNCDLMSLMEDMMAMFRYKAEERNISFSLEMDSGVPAFIFTDEIKLRQILINLLGNALKFTLEGAVTVRVKDKTPGAGKSTLRKICFEVEDTGPGITGGEQERIFDPFFRAALEKDAVEGTGLGLPISRRFAELLGGDMALESYPGKGSVFSFHIMTEVLKRDKSKDRYSAFRITGIKPEHKPLRLLIVDDIADARRLISRIMAPVGFQLKEAANGLEACKISESFRPHMIFMDIRMPVMDGCEATRRIKSSENCKDSVIVAVTASVFEEERTRVMEAGCDEFLLKPVLDKDLFRILKKYLGECFIYEKDPGGGILKAKNGKKTSLEKNISDLPDYLTAELEEAASFAEMDRVSDVIREISVYDELLSGELAELADGFAYDKILAVIKQAGK